VLRSNNVNESIIVPPGVRQILIGLRQNHHGIMGLFGGKFKVEEPVVVEGTIKPEPAAGGKPTAEVENPL
jgi:hypothetical protein